MKGKQIKELMSGTPWKIDRGAVVDNLDYGIADVDGATNTLAITTAVNATYGQSIDPIHVKAMYDMLGEISAWVSMNTEPSKFEISSMKQDIDQLLNSAKL